MPVLKNKSTTLFFLKKTFLVLECILPASDLMQLINFIKGCVGAAMAHCQVQPDPNTLPLK